MRYGLKDVDRGVLKLFHVIGTDIHHLHAACLPSNVKDQKFVPFRGDVKIPHNWMTKTR